MRKLYAIVIPLLAALAFATVPATASATVAIKKHSNHEALGVGAPISGFSSNLELTLNEDGGTLNCKDNTVTGEVLTNDETTATASITDATFLGKEGAPTCETSALGEVEITAEDLPWSLALTEAKEGDLTSGAGTIAFRGVFIPGDCTYSTSEVKETFKKEESPFVLTIASDQKFKLDEGSDLFCPTEGTLTGSFTVTSASEALEASV